MRSRSLIGALSLALVAACAGSSRPDWLSDGATCVCSAVSACCDGCNAISVGQVCDDGLSCSATSTCSHAGACEFATATCSVAWPECQSRTCSETAGCGATTNIREGFTCDDGNAQTYDDTCQAGTCAGTVCECSLADGWCCDGCHFRGAGVACATERISDVCSTYSNLQIVERTRYCVAGSAVCGTTVTSSNSTRNVNCSTTGAHCEVTGSGADPSMSTRSRCSDSVDDCDTVLGAYVTDACRLTYR